MAQYIVYSLMNVIPATRICWPKSNVFVVFRPESGPVFASVLGCDMFAQDQKEHSYVALVSI